MLMNFCIPIRYRKFDTLFPEKGRCYDPTLLIGFSHLHMLIAQSMSIVNIVPLLITLDRNHWSMSTVQCGIGKRVTYTAIWLRLTSLAYS